MDALTGSKPKVWDIAMKLEMQALQAFGFRKERKRPRITKFLHSKFVLRHKRDHRGEIKKFKARLVVCGNKQKKIDLEIFSPVVDYTLIKIILCLDVQKKYMIKQFRFQNVIPNK